MSDNTASNLGTGQGIFAQKVGDDSRFKGPWRYKCNTNSRC